MDENALLPSPFPTGVPHTPSTRGDIIPLTDAPPGSPTPELVCRGTCRTVSGEGCEGSREDEAEPGRTFEESSGDCQK